MNKEQAYDDLISPLMSQVIALCEAHDITFIASFSIPTDEQPALMCSTVVTDNDTPVTLMICAELLRATARSGKLEDQDAGA